MSRKASRWEGQTIQALRERWDRPNIHLHSLIDSTNEHAKALADDGAPAGTIVLADMQSGGRGLGDRSWYSQKGAGLYLSLVFRPQELANPLLVPLLAGLGTARAVESLVRGPRVSVKWPNDLIVDDRKAGGILSEVSWQGSAVNHLVLGIGINVHNRPDDFPEPLRDIAISLDTASGRTVSRLELADQVLDEVEDRCANLPEALDLELLREFDDYDWLRDRRCAIETSSGSAPVRGTAVGIGPDGALLFRPDKGALQRITAGRIRAEELALPDY